MTRMICLLIFLFSFTGYAVEYPEAFVDEPDPLGEASNALDILSGEPSTIVHHSVNIMTGDYIDMQTDLIIPGKELFLQRLYCGSDASCLNPFRAWKFNHDISAYHPVKGSKSDLVLNDAFGAKIGFIKYKRNGGCLEYLVHSEVFEKRITNTAREMSGRSHLKNKILLRSVRDDILLAKDGAGSEYHFSRPHNTHKVPILRLVKPDGNQIHYQYDQDNIPTLIKAVNREGKLFGQLEFKKQNVAPNQVILEASSSHGATASYTLSKVRSEKKSKWILRKASSSEAPSETYQYDADYKKILRKDLPDHRFQEIQYYSPGDSQRGRVMALKAPVGKDFTSIPIYRFVYHVDTKKKKPKEILNSKTEVYDAYQHQKVYHFARNERLRKIEYFKGTTQYQLYSQERFFWGAPETPDAGNLSSKVFSLADGKKIFCRTYSYDFRGNVTGEYLYGNLSGTCKASLVLNERGKPISNGCECLSIGHEYTQDGRNLVKYENHPEHAHDYLYEYHEGIGLVKGRYTVEGEAVRQRKFFDYDASNSITTEIIDDGSSLDSQNLTNVTERRIKRIRNCQSFPLGLPETIEEKYLDLTTGQERLLKKLNNHYDQKGRLYRQMVCDNEGIQAYTLEWKYDERGLVIEETNALGQTSTYKYDSNDNKVFAQGPRKDVHHVYAHDYMNRLIREEEVWNDGTRLVQTYQYDYLGNQIARTDIYGNETQYSYDDFSRLKKIVYPAILDENGRSLSPTVEKEYDALGYVTVITDANGAKTTSLYTILGKPYFIQHPDGSQEQFEYTLKGQLTKAIARNGSYTFYSYDYLSRPVKEEVYSSNGTILTAISRVYNAFHLLQETDAAGCSTYYRYDGAGRLVCSEKDNSRIEYAYDSHGRQSKKREFFGSENTQYLETTYSFDFLDRLLTETIQDASGHVYSKIAYSYDAAGNRQEVITYNQAGISIEKTKYNPHGDPIESINALGDATHICYHYPVANRIETTDPLGRVAISTQDALGRVVCLKQKNALGQLIKKSEYRYDAIGNRKSHMETVLTPQKDSRRVVTKWNYNNMGDVVQILEASGTSNQKNTCFTYNKAGEVTSKIKADGKTLRYAYDSLGRLQDYSSSDDSFHYTYEYDLKDNPIQINDLKNSTRTSKEFDRLNRLTKETLGHGLVLSYVYDRIGRVTVVTLPDQSKIKYEYQGLYLHQAVRLDAEGNSRYTHTYEAYDLAGNPTQATLIQNAGTTDYQYDLLARLKQITAPNFKETLDAHDAMGNLIKRTFKDSVGVMEGIYSYEDLDQLQSESGNIQQNFIHDSHYNQLGKDEISASVNSLNQLTELGESRFKYDQNGNRILKQSAQGEVRYGYDARDRLVDVVNDNKKVVYQYDSSDRRLTKISYRKKGSNWQADKTIRYLYQGNKEIGAYDAEGSSTELRVLSPRGAVAIELQGQVFAPLHDHLGNVVSLIKEDGTPYEIYRYSAFGEEQLFDANGQPIEQSLNPWRYAGKRKDDTGLIYFGKRYYDPTISRWLTPDPAGFIDSMNLYAYLQNNPFKYTDPDGRFAILLFPLISIAFGTEVIITTATMISITDVLICSAVAWGAYELAQHIDTCVDSKYQSMHQSELDEERKKESDQQGQGSTEESSKKSPPRTEPRDVSERITLLEAEAGAGRRIMEDEIKDPRYPKDEWEKKQHEHFNPDGTKINIHYWEHIPTKERHGFKYKDD